MRRHRVMMVVAGAAALWWAAPVAVTAASAAGAIAGAGIWHMAIEVPGLGSLNKCGRAFLALVSCASAGNCTAGGPYTDVSDRFQVFVASERNGTWSKAFVVSERNGTWGKAIKVPGSGTLNKDGSASVRSVSCRSAGNCSAGGFYRDRSGRTQSFVVSQAEGWLVRPGRGYPA